MTTQEVSDLDLTELDLTDLDRLGIALRRQRAQLVREVHDVVGHALTVVHVQATVALELLGGRADEAAPALAAVKEVSGRGLQELRAALALTAPAHGGGGRERLHALVSAVRGCGLEVELRVTGERPVPPAVGLAAYRIAQESLTNVVRHAASAAVTVELRYEPDALVLEITDDGRGAVAGPGGGGSGIAGMDERARALGGCLEAGPHPDGGFRVRARLPVPP